jgi:hypothetical protein
MMDHELSQYQRDQLVICERVIGKLNQLRQTGHCDSEMGETLAWLVDEMLFLRQILHSHPPALTAARMRAIIGNR